MKRAKAHALILLILSGTMVILFLPTMKPEQIIEPKVNRGARQYGAEQDSIKRTFNYAQNDTLPPPSDPPALRPVIVDGERVYVSWEHYGERNYFWVIFTSAVSTNTVYATEKFTDQPVGNFVAGRDYWVYVVAVKSISGEIIPSGNSESVRFRVK